MQIDYSACVTKIADDDTRSLPVYPSRRFFTWYQTISVTYCRNLSPDQSINTETPKLGIHCRGHVPPVGCLILTMVRSFPFWPLGYNSRHR